MARRANSPSRPRVTIHQFAPASVGSRESPIGSPTSMTQSPTQTYLASEPTGHVATTRPRTRHALAQARHLRPLSGSAERLWNGEDGRNTGVSCSGSSGRFHPTPPDSRTPPGRRDQGPAKLVPAPRQFIGASGTQRSLTPPPSAVSHPRKSRGSRATAVSGPTRMRAASGWAGLTTTSVWRPMVTTEGYGGRIYAPRSRQLREAKPLFAREAHIRTDAPRPRRRIARARSTSRSPRRA